MTIYPKQYSIKFLTSMMEMSPESLMFVFTEKCSVFQTSRSVLPRVK